MPDMQTFYRSLVSKPTNETTYQRWLARLTQITRDQIAPLRSQMAWDEWSSDPSA